MKINTEKWTQDRVTVETGIRTQKDKMRAPGAMPSYRDYTALTEMKAWATTLYKIRAQARGHQHQQVIVTHTPTGEKKVESLTQAQELAEIQHLLSDYVIPEPVAEAAA